MRSIAFVGLLPLVARSSPAAAEDAEDAAWTFEVSDQHAASGDRVYFRLAWENRDGDAVRVPAELLKSASLSGQYCAPTGFCRRHKVGRATVRIPNPPDASTVPWVQVPGFTAVERHGDLAEIFPEQCKGGCAPGTYYVSVWVPARQLSKLAPDQRLPEPYEREMVLGVETPRLPVRSASWIELEAKAGKPKGDQLPLRITVKNVAKQALYLPQPSACFVLCDERLVKQDGKVDEVGQGAGAGGQSPYDESEAILLRPGKSHTYKVTCDGIKTPDASVAKHFVIPRMEPFREFRPSKRLATPYYLDLTLRPPELQLR